MKNKDLAGNSGTMISNNNSNTMVYSNDGTGAAANGAAGDDDFGGTMVVNPTAYVLAATVQCSRRSAHIVHLFVRRKGGNQPSFMLANRDDEKKNSQFNTMKSKDPDFKDFFKTGKVRLS